MGFAASRGAGPGRNVPSDTYASFNSRQIWGVPAVRDSSSDPCHLHPGVRSPTVPTVGSVLQRD